MALMRRWVFFVLVLCMLVVVRGEVDEKDVLVLDDSNFDSALVKYDHMLVEFYAPWCGHCKELTPNWVSI